ncbi:MAG: ribose-phosphate diphosphokinase [bacterium]
MLENTLRVKWLKDVFALEPGNIHAVNTAYGELDWFLPESFAIYWAYMGIQHSPKRTDMDCYRMITQSLQVIFTNGRMLFVGKTPNMDFLLVPNISVADAASQSYLKAMEENPKVPSFRHAYENFMSPDDHFQDLKRVIAAACGKAHRVNVIMPYLYEGRRLLREGRESIDCASALQELAALGVENIITFDAHDPRAQNAIPLYGFESMSPSYQFLKNILRLDKNLKLDDDHLMVVSPDEGGMHRAIYLANVLGVNMGMLYKRHDYSTVINGKNPVVALEFLGSEVKDKDIIIIDDMISSGEKVLETADALKKRGAGKIFICATFGIFTGGLERFDDAYKKGLFDHLITTNLVYQPQELLVKPYYRSCDMSKYLALIIDTLNHDASLSLLLNPVDRINKVLKKYRDGKPV